MPEESTRLNCMRAQPPTLHGDRFNAPESLESFFSLSPYLSRFDGAFLSIYHLIELAAIGVSSSVASLLCTHLGQLVHKTHRPFSSPTPSCGGSQCNTSPRNYLHLASAAASSARSTLIYKIPRATSTWAWRETFRAFIRPTVRRCAIG